VLNRVACAGPQTPRALAEFDHVQPPSMTRTIASLVQSGLLVRTPHPDDGRQVLVDLTDAGRAEVAETRGRRTAWLASRIADLRPDERVTLAQAVTILERMVTR
jgi:DNA-binding MarR family transcriptional regulator